ncbi:hypothetical protein ES707_10120 [subsurface metagenome]
MSVLLRILCRDIYGYRFKKVALATALLGFPRSSAAADLVEPLSSPANRVDDPRGPATISLVKLRTGKLFACSCRDRR